MINLEHKQSSSSSNRHSGQRTRTEQQFAALFRNTGKNRVAIYNPNILDLSGASGVAQYVQHATTDRPSDGSNPRRGKNAYHANRLV